MKFHLQAASGNTITGFGPGWIRIGTTEYRASAVVTAETIVSPWIEGGVDALTEASFAPVLELSPEIVLLGTGAAQRFPSPRLYRALLDARIGVEVMDTGAACRTYNIIAGEGRRVAAALIVEG